MLLYTEESARLKKALEEADTRAEEYARLYAEKSKELILSVADFKTVMQIALTQGTQANREMGDAQLRFNSTVKTLVTGEFEDAANGLPDLLKVDEEEIIDQVREGIEAMEREIKMFGDAETIELFDYVVNQR